MHVFVIKKIRESKNITIYKLAKMVGISRSYLIEIENNKKTNKPRRAEIKKNIDLKSGENY